MNEKVNVHMEEVESINPGNFYITVTTRDNRVLRLPAIGVDASRNFMNVSAKLVWEDDDTELDIVIVDLYRGVERIGSRTFPEDLPTRMICIRRSGSLTINWKFSVDI